MFSTINSVISPQIWDAIVPSLIDCYVIDEKVPTNIAPKLSYTGIRMRIVNQQTLPKSLNISRVNTKNFNETK